MKKIFTFAAVAAVVLSSCAKVESVKVVSEKEAISFGVYTGKAATKAVSTTEYGYIDNDILKASTYGFGVFAYYSDGDAKKYVATPTSNFKPNFMYNQQVKYKAAESVWEYSPVKYWPNEYNNTDAIGADIDRLTFFAYAPFVDTPDTEGVTSISAATATQDPTIGFKVPASSDKQIDLLWSDAATTNLTKPAINTPVHFTFKHALSNLSIIPVAVVDAKTTIPASAGTDIDAATTVTINSITVSGKFDQEGTLNIATGEWTSSAAAAAQTVTYAPATPFDVTDINDKAEATAYIAANPGVLPEFMFIPSSGAQDYVITIDYDFTTTDSRLDGGEAVVHNVIHKTVSGLTFAQGKKIKMYIGLGITSVVVDAEVGAWVNDTDQNIWLPINL